MIISFLESIYLIYNIGFSFIYYQVGKSTQKFVNADGELVTGTELSNKYKDASAKAIDK